MQRVGVVVGEELHLRRIGHHAFSLLFAPR
jgi:hypothetical protein